MSPGRQGGENANGGGLERFCRIWALAGGLVVLLLALLTVASVLGRSLFALPLPGDFELVEIGCGVAVFCFLPYCHCRRGNVFVDFVTARLPRPWQRLLDGIGELMLALLALLLAWRMTLGGLDFVRSSEESMVLGVPLWCAFPPMVFSLGLLAAVALQGLWRRLGAS